MMLPILITLMVIGAQALPQLESLSYSGHHYPYHQESLSYSGHHYPYHQESPSYSGHHNPYRQVSPSNFGHHGRPGQVSPPHFGRPVQVSPPHFGRPVQGTLAPELPQRPSTTPGDTLIRKFDDGDDLPGDCTIVDFNAGDIRECASKGTYPESLNGTFGNSVPSEVECTNTGFIQKVLNLLKKDAQAIIREKNLDPLSLPDYVYSFSKNILNITFYGEALLYNGYIAGLSEFNICGHFVVDGNVVTGIEANATFPILKVTYSGKANFMDIGVQFTVTANTIGSIVYMTFVYNNTSCQFEATDVSLRFGLFNFVISGLGPLDWILSGLITALVNFFQEYLEPLITKTLKDVMNEAGHKVTLDSITPEFPFYEYLLDCSAFQ